MNSGTDFSLLDVFDLPDLHREIVLYLARSGPADATTLVQAIALDLGEVQSALDGLVENGRLRLLADGRADAVLGRVESRTTLPAQLWNALLATDRLYSIQDFATLRTAVPILQAARARLVEFVGHDPGHALRVKSFASQLAYTMGLTQTEQQLLRAGALFHDVGNIVDRERHYVVSIVTSRVGKHIRGQAIRKRRIRWACVSRSPSACRIPKSEPLQRTACPLSNSSGKPGPASFWGPIGKIGTQTTPPRASWYERPVSSPG